MPVQQRSNSAIDLLAQFVPSTILEKARDLAQQIEREEYVRGYIESKGLIFVLAGVIASVFWFIIILLQLSRLIRYLMPLAPWLKATLWMGGVVLWLASTLALMYFILSSLQRKALSQRDGGEY